MQVVLIHIINFNKLKDWLPTNDTTFVNTGISTKIKNILYENYTQELFKFHNERI